MPQSAIVIDERDNVATALGHLEAGVTIRVEIGGEAQDVALRQTIPMGHKFALRSIEPGEPVIKYGEVVGLATKKILNGEHAHVHNVEGPKGRRYQE
ncbi:MAG: D-galactarate dehydratase [Anaerolineae bacterium]|nr:D-galactarate dehydratase [Anaerolineae bacterium]NIN99673.1 D-galactarate dehydratase [Anaerolineae bacterium]NIQ82526.1 D-galactarate dehydratase [Anaerolineae bacterium]